MDAPVEFDDLALETKRRVFQDRLEQFLVQAYSWHLNAETLKRQRVPRLKLKIHQRDIDESLENSKKALDAARITQELMDELLPLDYEPEMAVEEDLTVENMYDQVSVSELEQRVDGDGDGTDTDDN